MGKTKKRKRPRAFYKMAKLVGNAMLPFMAQVTNKLIARHECGIPVSNEQQDRRPPSMSRTMPPARVAVPKSSAKLPTLTSGKGASPALEEELMKHPGRHLVPQPKTTLFIKLSQTCPRQLAQSRSRHGMFHPKLISPAPVALLV